MNKTMKRILLILGIALAFVACEKEEPQYADIMVLLTPKSAVVDRETGGVITIETDKDSYVKTIAKINFSDNPTDYYYDTKHFNRSYPPEYIIKLEDIMRYDEYKAFGCRIVPDGLRKYTITIEPNCDFTHFEIYFGRIFESKKHGMIGDHAPSIFNIRLE